MKLLVFLRDLGLGGAERQFLQLTGGLAARGHEVLLATRAAGGPLSSRLHPDVRRVVLDEAPRDAARTRKALDLLRTPGRLAELVRAERPQVCYSALYLNDAIAHRALVPGLPGASCPLVWGFRGAAQPLPGIRGWAWRYTRRHAPSVPLAIFNSRAGLAHHEAEGFRFRRTLVVPNGIDTDAFRPDPDAGRRFRERCGLPPEAFVVGCVGRLDPVKDHPGFLAAAARLAESAPEARFVCVGGGEPGYARELRERAAALDLGERVVWTGALDDLRGCYAALDVLASTSLGEGFPNTLGEALACGVPAVATDVGDCGWILGSTGELVPPRSPEEMAAAWRRLLEAGPDERRRRGAAGRERIRARFGLEACVEATEEALAGVVASAEPELRA